MEEEEEELSALADACRPARVLSACCLVFFSSALGEKSMPERAFFALALARLDSIASSTSVCVCVCVCARAFSFLAPAALAR